MSRLFFANVFRYSGRHRLADHAYQRTRRDLLAQAGALCAVLKRHGLRLNMKMLRERQRRFSTHGQRAALRARQTARRLDGALGRLERLLSAPNLMG